MAEYISVLFGMEGDVEVKKGAIITWSEKRRGVQSSDGLQPRSEEGASHKNNR